MVPSVRWVTLSMVVKLFLDVTGKFVLTTLMFTLLSTRVTLSPLVRDTAVLGDRLLLCRAALKTRMWSGLRAGATGGPPSVGSGTVGCRVS